MIKQIIIIQRKNVDKITTVFSRFLHIRKGYDMYTFREWKPDFSLQEFYLYLFSLNSGFAYLRSLP